MTSRHCHLSRLLGCENTPAGNNQTSCRDPNYTRPLSHLSVSSSPSSTSARAFNSSPLPPTLSTPVFARSLRLCQDLPHLPCSPKQSCKVRVLPNLAHLSLLLCPLSLSLHPSALWKLSLLFKCFLFIQCSAVSIPLPQEAFLGCSHRIL